MIKLGGIPPHFVFFLHNENILISNFESSSMKKEFGEYNKMLVHFPYCLTEITIQVVFDPFDNSLPPDFIIIKNGDFLISYKYITENFSFRNSNSLYLSLFRIKLLYSIEQENLLTRLLTQEMDNQTDDMMNNNLLNYKYTVYEYINKILFYIKTNFTGYWNIPKILQKCDVSIDKTNYIFNQVTISYPLDFIVRGCKIIRTPQLNICIPIDSNFDMKFWIELGLPRNTGRAGLNILKENEELSNYKTYINGYERFVIQQLTNMKQREEMITSIIEEEIGFVLEIDTLDFLYCAIYFDNFILKFVFSNEDNSKFEMQILSINKLEIIVRIKIQYGRSIEQKKSAISTILDILSKTYKVYYSQTNK